MALEPEKPQVNLQLLNHLGEVGTWLLETEENENGRFDYLVASKCTWGKHPIPENRPVAYDHLRSKKSITKVFLENAYLLPKSRLSWQSVCSDLEFVT
jgi:hypothetical protein